MDGHDGVGGQNVAHCRNICGIPEAVFRFFHASTLAAIERGGSQEIQSRFRPVRAEFVRLQERRAPAATYTVGGAVNGLSGSVTLANNGGDARGTGGASTSKRSRARGRCRQAIREWRCSPSRFLLLHCDPAGAWVRNSGNTSTPCQAQRDKLAPWLKSENDLLAAKSSKSPWGIASGTCNSLASTASMARPSS